MSSLHTQNPSVGRQIDVLRRLLSVKSEFSPERSAVPGEVLPGVLGAPFIYCAA